MDENNSVSKRALQSAAECVQEGCYGRAFAHYILAFNLDKEELKEHEETFCAVYNKWADDLISGGRIEDLFHCQEQVFELFPSYAPILNSIGTQLFRLGYIDESASFFRKCLISDPTYMKARENLENLKGCVVERWHFKMLNDKSRNEAFRNAIVRAVTNGYDNVLDIGTGTGLLRY